MNRYRILGVLWVAFCCYACFNELRAVLAIHLTPGLWPAWCVLAGFCLLFLVGIVASLCLFRGARWARWFVGSLAVLLVLCDMAYMVTSRSLPSWAVCVCVFAIGSLVLLLLPKHEPVA
jgi:hypothetical protein